MVKQGILADLHPAGQETSNGSSAAFKSQGEKLGVSVDVTAVVTSVDFEIEWSPDGQAFGSAETADTFTQITTASTVSKAFDVKAPFYRLTWTTADATFSAAAH